MTENILHEYTGLLRGRTFTESSGALHNIIRTICAARQNRISGEDFQRLDFGNIPFNGVHWRDCVFDRAKFNEFNFLSGHTGWVYNALFSPEGDWVVTYGRDRNLIFWNPVSGLALQKMYIPDQHTMPDFYYRDYIRPVTEDYLFKKSKKSVLSSDEKYILRASDDWKYDWETSRVAFLFDAQTKQCIRRFEGHTDNITSFSFSPDEKMILTSSLDGTARLWDINSGKCLHILGGNLDPISNIVVSPDEKLLLMYAENETIQIQDMETGKCIQILEKHEFQHKDSQLVQKYRLYAGGAYRLTDIAGEDDRNYWSSHSVFGGKTTLLNTETGACIPLNGCSTNKSHLFTVTSDREEYWLNVFPFGTEARFSYDYEKKYKPNEPIEEDDIAIFRFPENKNGHAICSAWYIPESFSGKSFSVYAANRSDESRLYQLYKFTLHLPDTPSDTIYPEPEILGEFFCISGLFFQNCSFTGIEANETTKKIIYQYGGEL